MNKENKIFKNNINVDNNLKYYYHKITNEDDQSVQSDKHSASSQETISDTLNHLLKHKKYLYTEEVLIKTKNKEYKTRIVSLNNDKLLTIDNDIIPISTIEKIEY